LVYGKPSAARSKNGQVVAADVIRGLLLWWLDNTLYINTVHTLLYANIQSSHYLKFGYR
jgi:hypothetical protein